MIFIISKGHSGTRLASHTLSASGVNMGRTNEAGDLVPAGSLYDAAKIFGRYVAWGKSGWSLNRAKRAVVPAKFKRLVEEYLAPLDNVDEPKGCKLPELNLIYPWLIQMYPEAYFIHWIRDPRDAILGWHQTDTLEDFGISSPKIDDERLERAVSYKYQYTLVADTPKPKNFRTVLFEDMVEHQSLTLSSLGKWLGLTLKHVDVNPAAVGRWKNPVHKHRPSDTAFLGYILKEHYDG